MLEQESVLCSQVVLLEIVLEHLFLLWMVVEVVSQTLVREELSLEFISLLHLDSFVVEAPRHVLNPRLDLHELLPENGHTLDYVSDTKRLLHLPLTQSECIGLLGI